MDLSGSGREKLDSFLDWSYRPRVLEQNLYIFLEMQGTKICVSAWIWQAQGHYPRGDSNIHEETQSSWMKPISCPRSPRPCHILPWKQYLPSEAKWLLQVPSSLPQCPDCRDPSIWKGPGWCIWKPHPSTQPHQGNCNAGLRRGKKWKDGVGRGGRGPAGCVLTSL